MRALFRTDLQSVFYCVLTLLLFFIPPIIEKSFDVDLPSTLETVILLFVFAAEILGELNCYYVRVPHWDTMLHTLNGFICAAVGFSLVDVLNRNKRISFNMSPFYLAFVAICFSMMIGVLWEFFEFSCDVLFTTDMQKDTVVYRISSVALDETNSNVPVVIDGINETYVNGEPLGVGGYLDIGLIDTMKDLMVNFVGAVSFSVIGYFYVKNRGKGRFARHFIPRVNAPEKNQDESCAGLAPGQE
jgi:hypothetical protein